MIPKKAPRTTGSDLHDDSKKFSLSQHVGEETSNPRTSAASDKATLLPPFLLDNAVWNSKGYPRTSVFRPSQTYRHRKHAMPDQQKTGDIRPWTHSPRNLFWSPPSSRLNRFICDPKNGFGWNEWRW